MREGEGGFKMPNISYGFSQTAKTHAGRSDAAPLGMADELHQGLCWQFDWIVL